MKMKKAFFALMLVVFGLLTWITGTAIIENLQTQNVLKNPSLIIIILIYGGCIGAVLGAVTFMFFIEKKFMKN